jgi:hypothetical protein
MMAALGRKRAFLAVTAALAVPALGCTERVSLLSAVNYADAAPEPEVDAAPAPDRPVRPDAPLPGDTGPEAKCSEFTDNVRIDYQVPQVVVALDRSFSMFQHKAGKTWWVWVKQALLSYMESNDGAVEFGYEEFPGRSSCDPSAGCCAGRVLVQPYLNSHSQIDHEWRCEGVSCYETSIESPSGDALGRIRSFYDGQRDPATHRFVLLVTDGEPSCAANPEECGDAGRQAGRMFTTNGVKTIVLPIGEEARTSACLEAVAVMGQTRQAGDTAFPWVGDPGQLDAQLAKAMAPVEERACRFVVRDNLQDRDKLVVTVNFKPLERDPMHQEGWDFVAGGAPEIQLFGSVCKKLKCSQLESRAIKAQVTCTQCGSNVTCP